MSVTLETLREFLKRHVPIGELATTLQKPGSRLLERRGGNLAMRCVNPAHGDEGAPSLMLFPSTGTWVCYGEPGSKGKWRHGDVIDFIGLARGRGDRDPGAAAANLRELAFMYADQLDRALGPSWRQAVDPLAGRTASMRSNWPSLFDLPVAEHVRIPEARSGGPLLPAWKLDRRVERLDMLLRSMGLPVDPPEGGYVVVYLPWQDMVVFCRSDLSYVASAAGELRPVASSFVLRHSGWLISSGWSLSGKPEPRGAWPAVRMTIVVEHPLDWHMLGLVAVSSMLGRWSPDTGDRPLAGFPQDLRIPALLGLHLGNTGSAERMRGAVRAPVSWVPVEYREPGLVSLASLDIEGVRALAATAVERARPLPFTGQPAKAG